jgi:peptidoglycan/LPS O-acetylase OafA/YrhL
MPGCRPILAGTPKKHQSRRKEKRTFIIMQNKRLIIIVSAVAVMLLIPLIAMQFTDEVNWTLFDFIAAAVLLLGTGLMCELVMRKIKKIRLRIAICAALLIMLLLIWAELAIGIFGSPLSGQ